MSFQLQPHKGFPGVEGPVLICVMDGVGVGRRDESDAVWLARTPTLDRLAARGVLFEDCVSSANVTLPSHAALMTGTSPRDTGVVNNADFLGDDPVTLAERFRDAGWVTYAAVSAGGLLDDRSGLGQGFDRMAESGWRSLSARDRVPLLEDWLDEATEKPIFVWLHVFDAHAPYAVFSNPDAVTIDDA